MRLRNILNSAWWEQRFIPPKGELDSFGIRHHGEDFECAFCARHYHNLLELMSCITKHIEPSPPS
jgi:hypothetical protein